MIKQLIKQLRCEHNWYLRGRAKKNGITHEMLKCSKCAKNKVNKFKG